MPAYDVAAYLPACLDSVLAQASDLGRTDARGRGRRRRLARRQRRDRGGLRRPGPAGAGGAHREPRPRRGPQRGVAARHGAAARLRRLRRRRAPGRLRRAAAPADPHRLGLRDRLGGPLGGAAGWSSRPGCGGCTSSGWTSTSTRCRRSSATCSRGTSCSAPTSGVAPGCPGPRGSATRTSRRPRSPTSRARRFGIIPEVVYHWRIRPDGSSITQQRSSLEDLRDRWETKLTSLRSVEEYDAPKVTSVFRDRVLAGDLHRYFTELPGCDDEWWELLRSGVLSIWGSRSLTHSGLLPVDRLVGWLVEQGRRDDAAAVVELRPRARPPGRPRRDPRGATARPARRGARRTHRRTRRPRAAAERALTPQGPSPPPSPPPWRAGGRLLLGLSTPFPGRASRCSTGMGSPRTVSDVSSSGGRRASAPAGDQA